MLGVFGAHANVVSDEFDVVREKFKCNIEESIHVMYCIIRFKKKSKWSLFTEVLAVTGSNKILYPCPPTL